MNTVKINKNVLIKALEENCNKFGDSFLGLYVDVEGNIECTDLQRSGDSMLILGFSGMGDYVDNGGLHADDESYDCKGVAEYIVNDEQDPLETSGAIQNIEGSETYYSFNFID